VFAGPSMLMASAVAATSQEVIVRKLKAEEHLHDGDPDVKDDELDEEKFHGKSPVTQGAA
jgi:hypothetical protein